MWLSAEKYIVVDGSCDTKQYAANKSAVVSLVNTDGVSERAKSPEFESSFMTFVKYVKSQHSDYSGGMFIPSPQPPGLYCFMFICLFLTPGLYFLIQTTSMSHLFPRVDN